MAADDGYRALPHRDDRRWVHPSELAAPTAPASGGRGSGPSRWARRRALPLGTAVVATATGAVVMFGALTVVGPDGRTGTPTRAGRAATSPAPGEPVHELVASTERPRPVGVVTVIADGRSVEGVVVAPATVVVAGAAALVDVHVRTGRGTTLVVDRVEPGPIDGLVTLHAPSLDTEPAAVTVPATDDVLRPAGGIGPYGTLTVVADGNPYRTADRCRALVAGAASPGEVLVDDRGRVAGLVAADDPGQADRLSELVRVDVDARRRDC